MQLLVHFCNINNFSVFRF